MSPQTFEQARGPTIRHRCRIKRVGIENKFASMGIKSNWFRLFFCFFEIICRQAFVPICWFPEKPSDPILDSVQNSSVLNHNLGPNRIGILFFFSESKRTESPFCDSILRFSERIMGIKNESLHLRFMQRSVSVFEALGPPN